jgi:AcrR family transcriptional regulator
MNSDQPGDQEAEVGTAEWWREHDARLHRRRPRPDGLTIERIIVTALDVIDAEGLDSLTVRRLGERMDTGSASLYRHVASREELLVLLVDEVLGGVVLPPADLPGRIKVEWLAKELRRVLIAHPHLLPALAASPLLGPNAMRGAQNALANLRETGFDPAVAALGYLAMIDFVLGAVYFDTSRAGRLVHEQDGDALIGVVAGLGAPRPTADDVFAFGLTTFLDGMSILHPDAAPTVARTRER